MSLLPPISRVPGVRRGLGLVIVAGLLAASATIAQALLLGDVIARVFVHHAGLDSLQGPLVALPCLAVLRAILLWCRQTRAAALAVRVKTEIRRLLLAHLAALGPAYTAGERTGELVTTAGEGVEQLDAFVRNYLPQVVLTAAVPALIALTILPIDPLSTLILLATTPIIVLLTILIGWHSEAHLRSGWSALARLGAGFLDAVQGLPTIILFGRVAAERHRLERTGEELRSSTVQALRIATLSTAAVELMCSLAIGVVAVALALRLIDGGISFQRALIVFFLTPEFYRPLRELGAHYHAGKSGRVAAARIEAILATPPAVSVPARPAGSPLRVVPGTPWVAPAIEFMNVTFTYGESDRPALSDVTLTLPAGSFTAIVGRSGAGKTTLLQLLLRFIDPSAGSILAGGIPLTSLAPDSWLQGIAYVPQRPHLFTGTLRENIALTRPDADPTLIERAAMVAGVDRFVHDLPAGYDTIIGSGGIPLSAGQAQRVALARAVARDAPLVLLDEPAANLDAESEWAIREALTSLREGRTLVVVAHRLATVRAADQIAVLEESRLSQLGSYPALLAAGGMFARLIDAGRVPLLDRAV